jgi:hypothetical protein
VSGALIGGRICCVLHQATPQCLGRRAVGRRAVGRRAVGRRAVGRRAVGRRRQAPATASGRGSDPRSTVDSASARSSSVRKLPNSATTTNGKNHTM